ncbi:MAG: cupin domain-containing protein [Pseudomonadota bacterium]
MTTELNADFSRTARVHAGTSPWIPSPMPGVERKLLDRIGDEVARATSIVRYAPGSAFSAHTHGGGEEFLVLDGVFQDEHGDYPIGTYVRNPPGTRHTPGSAPGCIIFVKLWQFAADDSNQFSVDANSVPPAKAGEAARLKTLPDVERHLLHDDRHETVCVEQWPGATTFSLVVPDGAEILVLDGGFEADGGAYRHWSWLRLPPDASVRVRTSVEGARVWTKYGHLRDVLGLAPA